MGRCVVLAALVVAGCKFTPTLAGDARGSATPIDAELDGVPDAITDAIPADWWDPDWHHRHAIAIDGTKLTGSLNDYQLLVKLPPTFDYAQSQSAGQDLRFIAADQTTVLAHDLDMYVVGGTSYIWVKIPTLVNTGTTTIWLYHGNATATSNAAPHTVFSQDVSVNHLGADFSDATGHAHDGTSFGGPTAVAGMIGGAQSFDGVDDYATLATESGFDFTTTMTVSAWIQVTAFTVGYQAIVTKGDSSWRMHRGGNGNGDGNGNTLDLGTTSASVNDNLDGTTNIMDGQWHHVAVTMDGTSKHVYVDGAIDSTRAYTLTLDNNAYLVTLGANLEASSMRYFSGKIDEVRILNFARGATWIAAEHLNVTDPTFVMVGGDAPI